MPFSLFVYYNSMVHISKTTKDTTLVQANFFRIENADQMPSKMSFYLMVRFWRNWPDHGKCGPGRTRQWAARRKLSESVKDMHIPIPAKKKVKIFKSFLKYSKSSMSAYANFTVNWELTVRIYSSPWYSVMINETWEHALCPILSQ